MKNLSTLFLLFVLCHGFAVAKPISENEALSIAENFFGQSRNKSAQLMTLAETSAGYYIFNRGENAGFVIVAADDRAENEVFGYVENGSFNQSEIPPALRYWLGEYDRQMSQASLLPQAANKNKSVVVRENIAPLVKTHWNQRFPYNNLTPLEDGEHCATGCVATAMAQIINYHRWQPNKATKHSYEWQPQNGAEPQTLSVDFADREYNWDLMLNKYDESSPVEAQNEVAQLTSDVGIILNNEYSYYNSGAFDVLVPQAFIEHFGIDQSLHIIERDFYEMEEWDEILYNELAENGPVYYSGNTYSGDGHAFVLDGYRDGYFHINWGWGGSYDGYFLTTALDNVRFDSEISFTYFHLALVGLKKAEIGSQPFIEYNMWGDFSISEVEHNHSSAATFSSDRFLIFNYYPRDIVFGLKVENTNSGETTTFYQPDEDVKSISWFTEILSFDIGLSAFPKAEGTYRVYPMCLDLETRKEYQFLTSSFSFSPYLLAEVKGDSILFSQFEIDEKMPEIQFDLPNKAYAGKTLWVRILASAQENEDFRDLVYLFFADEEDNKLSVSDIKELDVMSDRETELWFAIDAPENVGEYYLYVMTDEDESLYAATKVEVEEAPDEPLELQLSELFTIENIEAIDPNDICIHARVKCLSGFYDGGLWLFFFDSETNQSVVRKQMSVCFGRNEEVELDFDGSFLMFETGKTYTVGLYYYDTSSEMYLYLLTADGEYYRKFTIPSKTSLEQHNSQQPNWLLYDTAGRLLKANATKESLQYLPKGMYILRNENGETIKTIR